jgi:hypothetical protein
VVAAPLTLQPHAPFGNYNGPPIDFPASRPPHSVSDAVPMPTARRDVCAPFPLISADL